MPQTNPMPDQELLPETSAEPETTPLSWGESIAASMRKLATDPEVLAAIEKRAF
jgi:hypothetical protein